MKHLGTRQLETDRLLLRRFTVSDGEAMFRNWASDQEVTKYLTWPTHRNLEETAAVLKEWTESYAKDNFYLWAIVPKESGEPVGSISVVSQEEEVQNMQVGYCIGKQWWHQGITSEALRAVVDFLMDEVGAQRIEAKHDPRNPHSGAVMEKCGMRYEGTLRRAFRNNQGICDICYYAVLAADRKNSRLP